MYLSRVSVSGLRASAKDRITCELPGRFSVLIGANGSGKTTLTDALHLAHPSRFPYLPRPSSSALGPAGVPRSIEVAYSPSPEEVESAESALSEQHHQLRAPGRGRDSLERFAEAEHGGNYQLLSFRQQGHACTRAPEVVPRCHLVGP
ncbi:MULTISPECIES: AAA family ATPase [unclassified Streptomyces]|uniref:AAA family ATPase n=1 Tax=unclassified Streptomyces TaxID=2593676 RepID=UPI00338FF527